MKANTCRGRFLFADFTPIYHLHGRPIHLHQKHINAGTQNYLANTDTLLMSGISARYDLLPPLAFQGLDAVHALIRRGLRWRPPILRQEVSVLQLVHLDTKWPAALDHLSLVVTPEAPS